MITFFRICFIEFSTIRAFGKNVYIGIASFRFHQPKTYFISSPANETPHLHCSWLADLCYLRFSQFVKCAAVQVTSIRLERCYTFTKILYVCKFTFCRNHSEPALVHIFPIELTNRFVFISRINSRMPKEMRSLRTVGMRIRHAFQKQKKWKKAKLIFAF